MRGVWISQRIEKQVILRDDGFHGDRRHGDGGSVAVAEVATVILIVVLIKVRLGWHGAIRIELMCSLLMRMRFPRHIPRALGAGAEQGEYQQMANEGPHVVASLAQSPMADRQLR